MLSKNLKGKAAVKPRKWLVKEVAKQLESIRKISQKDRKSFDKEVSKCAKGLKKDLLKKIPKRINKENDRLLTIAKDDWNIEVRLEWETQPTDVVLDSAKGIAKILFELGKNKKLNKEAMAMVFMGEFAKNFTTFMITDGKN